MIFFCNITKKQRELNIRLQKLYVSTALVVCEQVVGIAPAAREANQKCDVFRTKIKTKSQNFKSFLPWTTQYEHRKNCIDKLKALESLISKQERAVKKGVVKKIPKKPTNLITKSHSDTEVFIGRMYKSPISQPHQERAKSNHSPALSAGRIGINEVRHAI